MKFRATYKPNRSSLLIEGEIREQCEHAAADAREAVANGATYAAVLRDSEGADHPANAGKFFLHHYIKA